VNRGMRREPPETLIWESYLCRSSALGGGRSLISLPGPQSQPGLPVRGFGEHVSGDRLPQVRVVSILNPKPKTSGNPNFFASCIAQSKSTPSLK
jgi:hypothetical protein